MRAIARSKWVLCRFRHSEPIFGQFLWNHHLAMVLSDWLTIAVQIMTAGFRLSTRKSRHQRTQQNGQTNQQPANRRTASTGNRSQVVEAKKHASFFKTLENCGLFPFFGRFQTESSRELERSSRTLRLFLADVPVKNWKNTILRGKVCAFGGEVICSQTPAIATIGIQLLPKTMKSGKPTEASRSTLTYSAQPQPFSSRKPCFQ